MNQEHIYIYEGRDIKKVFINIVLLYILGNSMYKLFMNGRINTENDAKYMINLPVVTKIIDVVTYILKWFGLRKPQAIDLLVSIATDIFILFVVMAFLILTLHALNYEHFLRILSFNIFEYGAISFVFIFKATIMYLIYELIHASCQILDKRY